MTHYQKLQEAINNFNLIDLAGNEKFFIDPVMTHLITIHDLLIFPYIDHEKFQQYIGWFRNDIRQDINRCLNVSPQTSLPEKQELLDAIKNRVKPKMKVVEFAFTYYLDNREPLYREWGAQVRPIKTQGLLKGLIWKSAGFKK